MTNDTAGERSGLVIAPEALASSTARSLIAQLDAELTGQYPDPADRHFSLAAAEVAPGDGAFLVAWLDGEPVGCGALRRLDDAVLDAGTGEIKRMYVAPAARGNGVGGRVLAELESEARRLDTRRLVLETGERQLEAIRMYERAGYRRIPCFGEYEGQPLSVCMGKTLVS